MREKTDEIDTMKEQDIQKQKSFEEELQSQESAFKDQMNKCNDAVASLQARIAELEQIEKDLHGEIEKKTREWHLLEEGKNKDIQRLSEKFEQAEQTIAMMKETEERTLKDHQEYQST